MKQLGWWRVDRTVSLSPCGRRIPFFNMRKVVNPRAELASGEYDRRRAAGVQQPGVEHIERLYDLKRGQLRHYRANYISRTRRKP
jgi:hypothetical protein